MTVTITLDTVKTILGIITALAAVAALVWKGFKWLNKQDEQSIKIAELETKIGEVEQGFDKKLQELRDHHDKDISAINGTHEAAVQTIQEEQTLMTYGLLACLKGLNEQGCDGPVSEAIDKIEKHINKRAHGQI